MEDRTYAERLAELVDIANSMPGTSGRRALKKIIDDLEGKGPVGELMFTLDNQLFDKVIDLMVCFRRNPPAECFNRLHGEARLALR